MSETFGERLRRLREAREISQSELGRRVRDRGGPTASYLSHLETGRRANPSIGLVAILAEALGCDAGELAGFTAGQNSGKTS